MLLENKEIYKISKYTKTKGHSISDIEIIIITSNICHITVGKLL